MEISESGTVQFFFCCLAKNRVAELISSLEGLSIPAAHAQTESPLWD